VKDLEALSYRARGQLRQLGRIRWLPIVIVAAPVHSMHGALDIHGSERRSGGTKVQIELPPVSAAGGDQG